MLALQGKEGDPLTSSSPLHYHTKHSHWAVIEDGAMAVNYVTLKENVTQILKAERQN